MAGAKRGGEGEGEKRESGEKERESLTHSPPSPSFFPLLPLFPTPFRRLLQGYENHIFFLAFHKYNKTFASDL